MAFITEWPVWAIATLIFTLRVCDVSLGTVRTIAVVQGRIKLSVVLGFFEVLIWVSAVSQVIVGIKDNPILAVAYAGGFAAGNAAGIIIERFMALGNSVVRIISAEHGLEIATKLRAMGQIVTSFTGDGRDGPTTLLYASCTRRDTKRIIEAARTIDPSAFYIVESVAQTSRVRQLAHATTGWRAPWSRK